jgi:hypothetical protein
VIVRRQDLAHCASITCMIRHYVSPEGAVIFDHPHNAADRAVHRSLALSVRLSSSARASVPSACRCLPRRISPVRQGRYRAWLDYPGTGARIPAVLVGGPIAKHGSPIAAELGDIEQ